jgi:hypothetical protein
LHEREVTAFFLAWMVCGVHALVRGERPLWTEQWRTAALLWLAVALVDLLAMAFDESLRSAWARPLHLAVWVASIAAACVFGYMAHRASKRRE